MARHRRRHLGALAALLPVLLLLSSTSSPAPANAAPLQSGDREVVRLQGQAHGDVAAPASVVRAAGLGGRGTFAGFAASPAGGGYWMTFADGSVITGGSAAFFGSMSGRSLNAPIVGIAASSTGGGYWLVSADGGIFCFGDAQFYGSMGGRTLNRPVIGMAATSSGHGYWLFAADGGIFAFGDAQFYGSTGGMPLNRPIVGMASNGDDSGYWLVGADGGVFAYRAPFHGSTGSIRLNQPMVGMLRSDSGDGYWLVGADGGTFAYGDATFYGSTGGYAGMPAIVGIAARANHAPGYVLVGADSSTWEFGPGLVASPPSGACAVGGPNQPPSNSHYSFIGTRTDGSAMRWSPCQVIHWKLSTAKTALSNSMLSMVQTAFDRLAAATGLSFTYDGTTSADASGYLDDPVVNSSTWKPVLVEPVPSSSTLLCGNGSVYAGCTQPIALDDQLISGTVVLRNDLSLNWSTPSSFGALTLHEVGHLVGLDHYNDPAQVMNPTVYHAFTDYQLGDLNGLWRVGRGAAALAKITPACLTQSC